MQFKATISAYWNHLLWLSIMLIQTKANKQTKQTQLWSESIFDTCTEVISLFHRTKQLGYILCTSGTGSLNSERVLFEREFKRQPWIFVLVITTEFIIIIIINVLTARVVGAPRMILQPVFSIFPCSPLPSEICQTPGLSISWCFLPTSSSTFLVFFPLSLCLARWFWPDLMNGKHDHTTAVCVSLWSSEGLHVVQLPAGSWHRLPHW